MAERPPQGTKGRVETRGDEAAEGSEGKRGELGPSASRRRPTIMGLAPAPHVAPGAGPGEDEARRRQRVLEQVKTRSTPPTGPPPPAAPSVVPPLGTTTRRMAPVKATHVLDEVAARLPSSSGWDVARLDDPPAPDLPSAPTVLVELRSPMTGPPPPPDVRGGQAPRPAPAAYASPRDVAEVVTTTEGQPRTASAPPQAAGLPPQAAGSSGPPAGLMLRRPESEPLPPIAPLDPRLVLLTRPDSTVADAYRALRDHLLAKKLPRVFAVSSPSPRDGKTSCAINLALALSESPSMRVLIVDGNYFKPELGQVFQMDRLAHFAPPNAESWLWPYRLAEVTPNLHLVALPRSDMPRPRFDPSRFEVLIDHLRRARYDYIAIDAPALHGTPAVGQLLNAADATLFALRAGGGTTARELRRAAAQVPKEKALGVALIDG